MAPRIWLCTVAMAGLLAMTGVAHPGNRCDASCDQGEHRDGWPDGREFLEKNRHQNERLERKRDAFFEDFFWRQDPIFRDAEERHRQDIRQRSRDRDD